MMTVRDRVGRASDVKLTVGGWAGEGACRNLVRSVIGRKLVCATRSRAQNASSRSREAIEQDDRHMDILSLPFHATFPPGRLAPRPFCLLKLALALFLSFRLACRASLILDSFRLGRSLQLRLLLCCSI